MALDFNVSKSTRFARFSRSKAGRFAYNLLADWGDGTRPRLKSKIRALRVC
jgi:hypothetical protein